MLDAAIATDGIGFRAGAHERRARRPGPAHRAARRRRARTSNSRSSRARPPAAGTSYPRVQVHAGRRLASAPRRAPPERGQRRLRRQRRVRSGAAHRCAPSITAACRICADAASGFDTLIAHVGERATYRLRTVTLGGLASRSTVLVKLAGRAARCELTAASIANGIQTHDMFAEIEHSGADTVTRELYRGIATDRGKLGFNGKMIVRESAPGADSDQSLKTLLTGTGAEAVGPPAARDLHRPRARQARRHHRQARRPDAVLPAVARHRPAHRADAAAMGIHRGRRLAHGLPARCAPKSNNWSRRSCNEVSALEGLLGSHERQPRIRKRYDAQRVWRDFPILAPRRCTASRWCSSTAPPRRSARPVSSPRSTTTRSCITPTCIAACTS